MRFAGHLRHFSACLLLLFGTMAVATAQDHRPDLSGVDAGRVDAPSTAVDSGTGETATELRRPVDLTRESRQFLSRSTGNAALLAEQGTSAFQRGLLPLIDYLNQLALAEYVEVRAADLVEADARVAVYRRQVERLEDAWQRLESFRQPASEGWQADTILAELALTEAKLKLAEAGGDTHSLATLRSTRMQLAREHLQQREIDYQLGHASLPLLAYAAKLSLDASPAAELDPLATASTPRFDRAFQELVLAQTQAWATMDAGVGRADRLGSAELDLRLNRLETALADGRAALFREQAGQAGESFAQLFDAQLEFHRHGTASLYDLAQTWVNWHHVHRLAATSLPDSLNEEAGARRAAALDELQSLVTGVHDLRGRHAGDVTFVRLAGQLDTLDTLYVDVAPQVEYLP